MNVNIDFYENYALPNIPKPAISATRRKLLDLIEVPETYEENSSDLSVRILINTPVLGNEGQRRIGKITMNEHKSNGMENKTAKFLFTRAGKKESSKSPPELERLTISDKKLQRNAKAVGLHVEGKLPSTLKLNSSFSPSDPCQTSHQMLIYNRRKKIVEEKKGRIRKAVKFLMNSAKARRDITRGANWKPPIKKLSTSTTQKDLNLEQQSDQSLQTARDKSVRLVSNENISRASHNKDAKKKVRRHTVATTQGISDFLGALEQLALAPINPSV